MSGDFASALDHLLRKAPAGWLTAACEALRRMPAAASVEDTLQRLPATQNADLAFLMARVVRQAAAQMSWEALGWTLQTTSAAHRRWRAEQHIEFLWSGPAPVNSLPARRIDQTLYDLIASAHRDILLVTFAAVRIERLTGALLAAAQTGVRIRLILEFAQPSEGQLSYDALKAFPSALIAAADVYYWPVDKRERNQAGRPGKLHAKLALVDDVALVSSANLTDDAFNRNLEIGVMVRNPAFLSTMRGYLEALIADGSLRRLLISPRTDSA